MELREIGNFKAIIGDSYSKPGEPGEGILLSHIWRIIELYNPNYTTQQKNLALITILEELMKKGLVRVNKAYSKGNKKPYWEKGFEEYIESLKGFLLNVPPDELEENDPEFVFIRFDYEFVDWQISSVTELEKYGLN